jgi:hypothetical protein
MKTFVEWAKNNKLTLPIIALDETGAAKRGGIHTAYPSAYLRSQYPDAYFAPIAATAYLDLKNMKGVKDKAPSDGAP